MCKHQFLKSFVTFWTNKQRSVKITDTYFSCQKPVGKRRTHSLQEKMRRSCVTCLLFELLFALRHSKLNVKHFSAHSSWAGYWDCDFCLGLAPRLFKQITLLHSSSAYFAGRLLLKLSDHLSPFLLLSSIFLRLYTSQNLNIKVSLCALVVSRTSIL